MTESLTEPSGLGDRRLVAIVVWRDGNPPFSTSGPTMVAMSSVRPALWRRVMWIPVAVMLSPLFLWEWSSTRVKNRLRERWWSRVRGRPEYSAVAEPTIEFAPGTPQVRVNGRTFATLPDRTLVLMLQNDASGEATIREHSVDATRGQAHLPPFFPDQARWHLALMEDPVYRDFILGK